MRSAAAVLYRLLFDAILLDPQGVPHGWEGFYFVENGEHTWYDISKQIGEAFVALGVSDVAEPTPFTDEELVRTWGTLVRIRAGCYRPVLTIETDAHIAGFRPAERIECALQV